jgi:hypothetical protein
MEPEALLFVLVLVTFDSVFWAVMDCILLGASNFVPGSTAVTDLPKAIGAPNGKYRIFNSETHVSGIAGTTCRTFPEKPDV